MKNNIPNAINKIQWRKELKVEDPKHRTRFEITIKENNKVIYHNTAYAGVINMVQSIDEFNVDELSFTGDTQVFGFGHPCIQLFALDQLRIKLRMVVHQATSILYKLTNHPQLKEFMESVGKINSIKKKEDYPKLKDKIYVVLFTDGGSAGNGTDNARGSICVTTEDEILVLDRNTGKHTSNDTEFLAIEKAVDILIANQVEKATIFTDSKLACNMVKGLWRGKVKRLQNRRDKIRNKIKKHSLKINFKWIPRNENKAGQVLEFGSIQKDDI